MIFLDTVVDEDWDPWIKLFPHESRKASADKISFLSRLSLNALGHFSVLHSSNLIVGSVGSCYSA